MQNEPHKWQRTFHPHQTHSQLTVRTSAGTRWRRVSSCDTGPFGSFSSLLKATCTVSAKGRERPCQAVVCVPSEPLLQRGLLSGQSSRFKAPHKHLLGLLRWNPMKCARKVLPSLVGVWETWGWEWLLRFPACAPGITQGRRSYLVVNFKFLYHPQLYEHPKGSRNHGINVQRKVIEMYVIDGKFRHQGNVGCLERQKTQVKPSLPPFPNPSSCSPLPFIRRAT